MQVRACICRIMENSNENQMEIRFKKGLLRVLLRSGLKNSNGVLGYTRFSPSDKDKKELRSCSTSISGASDCVYGVGC